MKTDNSKIEEIKPEADPHVLVQREFDELFYAGPSRWTKDKSKAFVFRNGIKAVEFAVTCSDKTFVYFHFPQFEKMDFAVK